MFPCRLTLFTVGKLPARINEHSQRQDYMPQGSDSYSLWGGRSAVSIIHGYCEKGQE